MATFTKLSDKLHGFYGSLTLNNNEYKQKRHTMGTWIAVITVIFLVGTIMGLRPSVTENRLDRLRTLARTHGLHPKLTQTPDWLSLDGDPTRNGKGMIAQYGVLNPDIQLTPCDYQIIDGKWRPFTGNHPANFALDKHAVDLPPSIARYVKGMSFKANFACIYWQENIAMNVKGNTAKLETTENDLILLETTLKKYIQMVRSYK